nr:BTAD domain-containing putative transcriptional regulator [Flexivirga meconopsidis]
MVDDQSHPDKTGPPVTFRVLGSLDVLAGDVVLRPTSGRQRAALAALLLSAGRTVPVDTLIDAIWDEDPPSTARNQVAICVAALRKQLKEHTGRDDLIHTKHPGYLLDPGNCIIDVDEFQKLRVAAASQSAEGQPAQALETVDQALQIWRGAVLDGLVIEQLRPEIEQLSNEFVDLHEDRGSLLLELGRDKEALRELTAVVDKHPLRECARALLMHALYRAGQRAEALRVFREGRRRLVSELGIEPGPQLQTMHERVLQDDAELAATTPESASASGPTAEPSLDRPAQLPAPAHAFTGRNRELTLLDSLLSEDPATPPIALVTGVGGVGKTSLAVRWATRNAHRFPDGQLFIDLRGFSENDPPVSATAALDAMLRALGVSVAQIPAGRSDRSAMLRSALADRSVLIVLDNAHSHGQLTSLIPGEGASRVIVTSRGTVSDLAGDHAVTHIELTMLATSDAHTMLGRIVGSERVEQEAAAADEIADLCNGLPLALRVVGARLSAGPHIRLESFARRLRDQRRRLDELSQDERGVRASLFLSYRSLSHQAATLFRRLGRVEVPDFAGWVASALMDVDPWDADDLLEQLAQAQLLEVVVRGDQPGVRYRMQDLVWLYARELAGESVDDDAALERFHRAFAQLARGAALLVDHEDVDHPDQTEPVLPQPVIEEVLQHPEHWFAQERSAIRGAVNSTRSGKFVRYSWQTVSSLATYFETGRYLDDWHDCVSAALEGCRVAGDKHGSEVMLRSLGVVAFYRGRFDLAREHLEEALAMLETSDRIGQARVRRLLASIARADGDLDAAYNYCDPVVNELLRMGQIRSATHAMGLLAQIESERGNHDRAIELSQRAVTLSRESGTWRAEAQSLYWMAFALMSRHDLERAAAACGEALSLAIEGGDRTGRLHALTLLGEIHARRGLLPEAEQVLGEALDIAVERADPMASGRCHLMLACTAWLSGLPSAENSASLAVAAFERAGSTTWMHRADRVKEMLATQSSASGDELFQRLRD